MTKYVLGIVFNSNLDKTLLLLKQKPLNQKGKYNAPGGHIEPHENDPVIAMRREYLEETGIEINDWSPFCELYSDVFSVFIYTAISDEILSKNDIIYEKEILSVQNINDLAPNAFSNLHWLIPMALNHLKSIDTCNFFRIKEEF